MVSSAALQDRSPVTAPLTVGAFLSSDWQIGNFRTSPYVDDPEVCNELLNRVARIRDVLAESVAESDRLGTLAPAAVEALTEQGLFRMRLSQELGGFEASIATQILVLAALAEIDRASAWCAMVGNNSVASLGAYFGDEAVAEFFGNGIPRAAGAVAATGRADPVEGGYKVTGQWKFTSGIRHSHWVSCTVLIEGDPARPLRIAIPTPEVTIHDGSWDTLGLRGTGSCDFSTRDLFVPAHRTVVHNRMDPKQRPGRRLYGREGVVIAAYEHAAIALGTASRAMREITDLFAGRAKGRSEGMYGLSDFGDETSLADIGRRSIELEAAVTLTLRYFGMLERMSNAESARGVNASHARVLGAYTTDVAARCVEMAYKRAGSTALYLPNVFADLLRDIRSAQVHVLVKDPAYPLHGGAVLKEAAQRLEQGRSNGQ